MAIFLDYIPDLLPYFWNSHHLRSPPLLAHRASLALAHLSTETFFDEEVKAVAKGIEADGVDNLAHKGKHCGYGVSVRPVSNELLGDSEK